MSTSNQSKKRTFVSWEFLVLKIALFGLVALMLDQPTGSIAGKIALEQESFGIYSYNIRKNKVFAVASGPRFGKSITRGVWVDNDGSFRLDRLPVGEYSLRIRAPGFATEHINSVFVEEGSVADISGPIKMSALEPYISIGSNVRVFTSEEKPRFWVNATGAVETTVKIYKKSFLRLVASGELEKAGVSKSSDLSFYTSYNKKFHNPFSEEKPFKQLKRRLNPNYTDYARADFKMSSTLPRGDYVVVAEALDVTGKKRTSDIWWFSVSDIGLIVKHAPSQTLVRSLNLVTMKAEPDVDVSLYLADSTGPTSVKTGADGTALIDLKKLGLKRKGSSTLVVGRKQDNTAYGASGYWQGSSRNHSTYFYSDRPVYRLGQTVSYKAILRDLTDEGFVNRGNSVPIHVEIEDPDNVKLVKETLKTSPHGTVAGSFKIPDEGKTGGYQVRLTYPDGRTSYNSIEVEQYRKPEYKVEVVPQTKRTIAGNQVSMRVRANYFFGAPVTNARIKYSVYSTRDYGTRYRLEPRPEYYSYFDGWEEDDRYYGYDYGGSFLSEGFATTDENGEALVTFRTKPIESTSKTPYRYYDFADRNYRIEAEVTDLSRMTVTASASTLVTSSDVALFVNPRSYVINAGDPISVDVEAIDYDGKPVAGREIELAISRWPWDRANKEYKPLQKLESLSATTDDKGRASVTFGAETKWPTDTFYITATARDSQGHVSMDGSSIWIASRHQPYYLSGEAADSEPFKITLDKKVYKPGETAKVMISGPFKGTEGYDALVTVEGTKIHDYRVIPLKATASLVKIPIKKTHAPNAYISVAMAGPQKQFYKQTKVILVSPKQHFLNITVESDKEKYKPGETANYTITATRSDGSAAANTELSLGVVDESIYSIRADSTPDIRKYFFHKRSNWVSTICSFPEQYSGGPDKINPRLRKNFKDTAAWIPRLITNASGIATAKVVLPDNLTTWRATVRGINRQTDVGAAVQKITVTQDIIARLSLPRFFTKGDRGEVTAIVHNYTPRDQKIRLTLKTTGQLKTAVPLTQELTVDKEKAKRFSWPVKIESTGKATLTLRAIGQTGGDALQKKLSVKALGIPVTETKAGVLTSQKPIAMLPFRQKGYMDSPQLTVKLAGSTIAQLKGAFGSLINYPYGCTEQTMSRLVPSIVAIQLHQKLGMSIPNKDLKKFAKVKKKGLDRLRELQHADGGWGWWTTDSTNPYLTAYVLEGIHRLEACGYKAYPVRVKPAIAWLKKATLTLHKQLSDPKVVDDYLARERRCDLARMVYTLSLYKIKPDKKVLVWLSKRQSTLAPEPLAYLTLAYNNLGRAKMADSTYRRLIALANRTDDSMDWEHTKQMLRRLEVKGVSDYTWRYTGVETTALALRAVLEVNPDNTERIESIKNWLLLHRSNDGWSNTKTTAEVLLALMKDALAGSNDGSEAVVADLLFGETLGEHVSFAPSERFNIERTQKINPTRLADGISISLAGEGKLYYQSLLNYHRTIKPGEKLQVKSSPASLKIDRKFFKLTTKATTSDGILQLRATPLAGAAIKPGEIVLMKVYVETPMSLPYVIIESPLPSGGEIVKSKGQENALSGADGGSLIEGDWGAPWWTHQDVLDDRIVFFGRKIPAGKSEFHTLIRMELPGEFQLNPVILEGMYTDLIRGYSQPASITVKE